MPRPVTEPTTPLRNTATDDEDQSTYSAPARARVSLIQLPPQELPNVLSELSSRRVSTRIMPSPYYSITSRGSPGPYQTPLLHPRDTYQTRANVSPRERTPTRRLSDHLTVRRRRRSSTGVVYDAAFAGAVNKEFLRLFAQTLANEQKQDAEESDVQVYRALDKQHRISSTSPQGPIRDFDLSLPLPSDDEMNPLSGGISRPLSPVDSPQAEKVDAKPVFKSYLEQILESRNRKSSRVFDSVFDKDSTEDASRQEHIKDVISTSKFIIENTLSGLPESWGDETTDATQMKLAEPVAFGLLHDDPSSNETSEKENEVLIKEREARIRSPQIFANQTPGAFGVQFDNIDHLDVPKWEPVSPYDDNIIDHGDADTNEITYDDNLGGKSGVEEQADAEVSQSDSELSQSGIISGHFTVDNDDIVDDGSPSLDPQSPLLRNHELFQSPSPLPPSPPARTVTRQQMTSQVSFPSTLQLPKSLVKGFVSVAQHLPAPNPTNSPSRKRRKVQRLKSDSLALISQKSNEFLSQVMQDLGAYAEHRDSKSINISDALLYINRIKSHHRLLGDDIDFPRLAQSVFPLELLMSLDNSLHESMKSSTRRKAHSKETSESSDEDYYD